MLDSPLIHYSLLSAIGALGLLSGAHALLSKRDPRAQLLWVGTCVMPLVGPLAYWFLGFNRIKTRARQWQEHGLLDGGHDSEVHHGWASQLHLEHPEVANNMQLLLQVSKRVTGLPLLGCNKVQMLKNGEEAFPVMMAAIADAKRYIYVCSYIFEGDQIGQEFARILEKAAARGVDVRVLVDAVGGKFGRDIGRLLRGNKGIRFERFLPATLSWRLLRINLRNHRKILVVDGHTGFTGGMNISDRHMVESTKATPTRDLHFKLTGPIVHTLEEVFSEDWCFRVGKTSWPQREPPLTTGAALCRGVKDGPNEDFEKLQWILIGALSCARNSVRILTPYFIPSRELLTAMRTAVLRGARVELILPQKSNLRYVDWATDSFLQEVVDFGIHVYKQSAPFDHSKILVVDEVYVNLGSANLDPRSLLLNFEFNVEVYDRDLASLLSEHHEAIKKRSARVQSDALASMSLPVRLRNATAKLFSPYL